MPAAKGCAITMAASSHEAVALILNQADDLGNECSCQGKVKFLSDEKGFGFIVPDDKGPEVFVHRTGIVSNELLLVDQRVSYAIAKSDKGNKTKAINVTVL
jgi:cold shock protein